VQRAVALRARLVVDSDAVRLVHGEADGLPGLVVDRYGDTLVAQVGFVGAERWKGAIADALLQATGTARLYERSDLAVRKLEGLPEQQGWLRGDGATQLQIREHGWTLQVDIAQGHKTGTTWTSATTGCTSRRRCGISAVPRCSTATATAAASRWRRWPAARGR
jgi:23S rRNA (cytosine1962-C5)-methyltransferase